MREPLTCECGHLVTRHSLAVMVNGDGDDVYTDDPETLRGACYDCDCYFFDYEGDTE